MKFHNDYFKNYSFLIKGVKVTKFNGREDHLLRSEYNSSIKDMEKNILICDFLANVLGEKNG